MKKFLAVFASVFALGLVACAGGISEETNGCAGNIDPEEEQSTVVPTPAPVTVDSIVYVYSLWNGASGGYTVNTGVEETGYWYTFADDADGGTSKVEWPVPLGNEYSDSSIDAIVDYCSGVCADVVLVDGYAGIGFRVAEVGSTADISAWGGICVTYTSDLPMKVVLFSQVVEEDGNAVSPSAMLPKTEGSADSTRCISWHEFTSTSSNENYNGDEVSKEAEGILFEFVGGNERGSFNIKAIGTYNENKPHE